MGTVICCATMMAHTARPSGGGFGRWGSETDQSHRDRHGRTRMRNIDRNAAARLLGSCSHLRRAASAAAPDEDGDPQPLPAPRPRARREIIVPGGRDSPPRRLNQALILAIARAKSWMRDLRGGKYADTIDIARQSQLSDAHVRRILRFGYLDDRFHETAQLQALDLHRKIRIFRKPHMIRTLEALD